MPSPADLLTTDVARAAEALRNGGLVAIPTETVYGLAADARRPAAVARIFEVKGRPTGHPLIVHIAGYDGLDGWIGDVSAATAADVARLAAVCWPGPLTMLVPRGPSVIDAVTGGRPAVGLRAPAHPLTQELIDMLGTGLAAPSANRFGRVSPTTAQHVLDDLVVAARELYGDLRRADVDQLDALIVVLPPAAGLGHAIRDRLVKAAAGSRPSRPNQGH